jgi:hypothetical protein
VHPCLVIVALVFDSYAAISWYAQGTAPAAGPQQERSPGVAGERSAMTGFLESPSRAKATSGLPGHKGP